MRHFTLVNNAGEELDITTKEILFHEIGGLGFEEENDFRQIGDVWWLNHSNFQQSTISGKMIFTEIGEKDPYQKYWDFAKFVSKVPLTMKYSPYGPVDDATCYFRTVRVSSLDKTEKNEYGVIDSDINFVAYTPWYRTSFKSYNMESSEESTYAWIWGDGAENPPLVFEPEEGQTATRARFRYEPIPYISMVCESDIKSPIKLTIFGPMENPIWTHQVQDSDGAYHVVATGGFAEPVSLLEGERLVIDSTNGSYSMTKYNSNGTETNMYQYRDFSTSCFITLHEGSNIITVTSSSGELATHISVEGHMYYATV